jgi:hypothetical protein
MDVVEGARLGLGWTRDLGVCKVGPNVPFLLQTGFWLVIPVVWAIPNLPIGDDLTLSIPFLPLLQNVFAPTGPAEHVLQG